MRAHSRNAPLFVAQMCHACMPKTTARRRRDTAPTPTPTASRGRAPTHAVTSTRSIETLLHFWIELHACVPDTAVCVHFSTDVRNATHFVVPLQIGKAIYHITIDQKRRLFSQLATHRISFPITSIVLHAPKGPTNKSSDDLRLLLPPVRAFLGHIPGLEITTGE